MKGSRLSGISLALECKNEELSDAQILQRKKQLEDIYMLQTALQGASQIDPNLTGSMVNGNAGVHGISSAIAESSVAGNVPKQILGFMNRNGGINGNNGIPNKRKTGNSASSNLQDSAISTGPAAQPPKSLTQALRATRKTTGNLPPSKNNLVDADNEPEIEVLQEMRTNTQMNKPPSGKENTTILGSVPKPIPLPIKPKVSTTSFPKGNNLLLLNINIRPRNLAPVSVNSTKRKALDNKVKVVLMKSASEFVEWLLQQGLIRSQQLCNTHKTINRQPTKLKLGMFSDPNVLGSSGGYVWIGECCGRRYISVYSGSVFGSTPIDKVPPPSVLKLVYHWSCQTSIANVETWVKVDRQFISKIYHYLKCICSVILHDKIYEFGVANSPVELGIVSLGTTTADGSRKAVKVEILGLYDRKTKSYRLFASTPEPASNSRERFLRILKPVREVVHKNAIIICDQSVDPTCLHSMGYSDVEVCYSSENENDPKTNSVIMFYLRKHVPKMFQAALSQLTEHQVQLTLDELCWREKFAPTSFDCYDNIMENISYITFREMENPGVLPLLEFVSEYPHNNFRYKAQLNNKASPSVPASILLAPTNSPLNVVPTQYNENKCLVMTNKVMTVAGAATAPKEQQSGMTMKNLTNVPLPKQYSGSNKNSGNIQIEKSAVNNLQRSNDYKSLEPYFYGRIEGNPLLGKEYNSYAFKCHLCSESLDDNIMFYSHMKYHFEGQTVEKDKLDLMCPYCTTSFQSVNGLNKHKIDVHLMSDLTQVWCRICSEKFQSENLLKTHMMRKHVEAELPYRCEVCHFATSFYYEIINHFTRSHKGTPYVQCHFCLCIKTLTPSGASSFSHRLFQHLQKHIQKINCRSCVLVFYSKYLLNEHRKEHLSCANVNGVSRYESPNGYRILQFKPNIRTMPIVSPSPIALSTKNQAALSITQDEFPNLKIEIPKQEVVQCCLECDSPLSAKSHFIHYRKCAKCSYFTSCQNMIMKHAQIFHPPNGKKPLPYRIGNPIILETPIYCSCGFSTTSGNHMANHLSSCKKTTAYFNPNTKMSEFGGLLNPILSEEPMEIEEGDLSMLPLSVEIEEV